MMIIDNKFEIGDTVYVRTDEGQSKGIITSIEILPNNLIQYWVSIRQYANPFYDFELSADKDVIMSTTN